jgi:hypothetical protein
VFLNKLHEICFSLYHLTYTYVGNTLSQGKSVEMIKKDRLTFLNTVLNNFSFKSGMCHIIYYSENSEEKTTKTSKRKS